MGNRLSGENSLYLIQHAENPVDWYPWNQEALERARIERETNILEYWILCMSLVSCNVP